MTPQHETLTKLEELDEVALRLKRFTYERRSCPSCKGLLIEPKPLRRNTCPVCQSAILTMRPIHEQLCPHCKLGVLSCIKNANPLAICPVCKRGSLGYRRKGLVSSERIATCNSCDSHFEIKAGKMTWMEKEETPPKSIEEWRQLSGRSKEVWWCQECNAQYDFQSNGSWTQVVPTPLSSGFQNLFPDEWARVAIGLHPTAGNAECPACGSDFNTENGNLTLVQSTRQGTPFDDRYQGKKVTLEDARWLGAGKTSAHPGFLCEECRTEFDKEDQYLRLVSSSHEKLRDQLTELKTLEDWHRLAQGLPTVDQEIEFEESILEELRSAYRLGNLSVDAEGNVAWRGEATRQNQERTATLIVSKKEISFGSLLGKKRQPTEALTSVWAEEDAIHFQFSGERSPATYLLRPIVLTAHLRSGNRDVTITARDLAGRLVLGKHGR